MAGTGTVPDEMPARQSQCLQAIASNDTRQDACTEMLTPDEGKAAELPIGGPYKYLERAGEMLK
jgi:hypothetical protein